MSALEKIDLGRLPQHVAIIMDGNGRWAKKRGLMRSFGHENGVTTVRQITEIASELGIGYLTLYTFSTENWNRPKDEVDALMNLIVVSIEQQTPDLIKNNVRLTTIGNMRRMPQFARERLEKCMDDTAHCTGLVLCLALSYSSRWEIVEACKKLAAQAAAGQIQAESIDDDMVSKAMATASMPDPDLLIRTAGDLRISNFLLWQIAYSELYFTPKFWPDFTKEDFCEAIVDYQSRERRFGKTSEQLK
ncbi:MAG: isoprenyl transferase [Bacteroidales bacterium]|nr:isoprenyl transferase [Muribaculaceae bacterium]MDY6293150.1 isoprenyl transferase [Bacteroidales bacterium]MDY6411401.1 isoprenyl transferase [Bacteroidales bacterium]